MKALKRVANLRVVDPLHVRRAELAKVLHTSHAARQRAAIRYASLERKQRHALAAAAMRQHRQRKAQMRKDAYLHDVARGPGVGEHLGAVHVDGLEAPVQRQISLNMTNANA